MLRSACGCRYLVERNDWHYQDCCCNSESTQAAMLRTSALDCALNVWRMRFHSCSFTVNCGAILFPHMYFWSSVKNRLKSRKRWSASASSKERLKTILLLSSGTRLSRLFHYSVLVGCHNSSGIQPRQYAKAFSVIWAYRECGNSRIDSTKR